MNRRQRQRRLHRRQYHCSMPRKYLVHRDEVDLWFNYAMRKGEMLDLGKQHNEEKILKKISDDALKTATQLYMDRVLYGASYVDGSTGERIDPLLIKPDKS